MKSVSATDFVPPDLRSPLLTHVRERAAAMRQADPEIRAGQSLFNALAELDPRLAERARGGVADPFYVDQRVPVFASFVVANDSTS